LSTCRIAHAYDFGTFAVMKSLLESEGVMVLDAAFGGHLSIAGVDQGYYLEVEQSMQARARTLLWENSFGKYLLDNTA